MWLPLLAAAAGSLESDFADLVETRHLHVDATAAQLWQLYIPSLVVAHTPTADFAADARAIALNNGWSTADKYHGNRSVFTGVEANHTCGQLLVDPSPGRWANPAFLMADAATGDKLLDVDVKLVAASRHTTLCGETGCRPGHECVSVGALPKLCLATRPPSVSDDSWLAIVLVLAAITVLVYHVWRRR